MEIVAFVIWVGFGFWTWYLAKNRGRNQVTGFILGLMFGVFALIGYLIAGDSQRLVDEKMVEREKRLKQLRKEL